VTLGRYAAWVDARQSPTRNDRHYGGPIDAVPTGAAAPRPCIWHDRSAAGAVAPCRRRRGPSRDAGDPLDMAEIPGLASLCDSVTELPIRLSLRW